MNQTFLLTSLMCFLKNKPFPQNESYVYGYQPVRVSLQNALGSGKNCNPANLIYCGYGAKQFRWDNTGKETVSEGIIYGLKECSNHTI